MSVAIVNDMCAWILLATAIAISEVSSVALSSLWVLLSRVLFDIYKHHTYTLAWQHVVAHLCQDRAAAKEEAI